jgi:peptidoglycan hydrolase-like protein with peptidoglycan-binding domain
MKKHKLRFLVLLLAIVLVAPSFVSASSFDASLKYGSSGSAVIELQNFLKDQGLFSGKADGKFGLITKKAVIAFQLANKLSGDGSFGPLSRKIASTLLGKNGNSNSSTSNQGKLPPTLAINACTSKAIGDACEFLDNGVTSQGVCDNKPGVLACKKNDSTATSKPQSQTTTPNTKTTNSNTTNTTANTNNNYSLEQAMSDNAFSGLAFITGSAGADTFFPPGKVADFNGFQYMRDVDTAGYGHNTTYLSKVANNVLYILNDAQKAKLVVLAKEQAPIYTNFAYNRFPLMNAFRRNLTGDIPSGSSGLSTTAVSAYTSNLYKLDADLSYNRALVVGEIINSFTDTQKAYLAKMKFDDYSSWPDVSEDATLKKSMTNPEFVATMTYASELFSWYKGNITADVYFCPERHGTYFGGFYMKDYLAMGDANYFISTSTTGDSGQGFLDTLNATQKALITGIISEQKSALTEIAQIRTTVSTELRKAITGGTINKDLVYSSIERYGELDGQMSALYAKRFAEVKATLTDAQMATLVKLRNLSVVPTGAYMFSTPTAMPTIPNTDFMFGVGTIPTTAGQLTAPSTFGVDASR